MLNEGNVYVKGGNQSFAKPERLAHDRQQIPRYYNELMNKGVVYVDWCDDDFYELLQQKGIKFSVKPCADFYERTKFELLKENLSMKRKKINENQFRQVPNLNNYILQNQLQMRQASKFQRINAIQARGGERINTIASDGTQETTNVANAGDWIVNNVSNPNNKWIINAQTFAKKYQPDPSHRGVYMPKGGPMNAAQINEPISFTAPWGEQMNIDKGGYILQDPNNPNDAYGISGPDFDNTYRFNESKKSKKKRINEAQLRAIVSKVVKSVLKEEYGYKSLI